MVARNPACLTSPMEDETMTKATKENRNAVLSYRAKLRKARALAEAAGCNKTELKSLDGLIARADAAVAAKAPAKKAA